MSKRRAEALADLASFGARGAVDSYMAKLIKVAVVDSKLSREASAECCVKVAGYFARSAGLPANTAMGMFRDAYEAGEVTGRH